MGNMIASAAKRFAAFAVSGVCAFCLFGAPAVAWGGVPSSSSLGVQEGTLPVEEVMPSISGVDQLEPGAQSWNLLRFDGTYSKPLYYSLSRAIDGATRYYMQGAPYTLESDSSSDFLANVVAIDMAKSLGENASLSTAFGTAPGAAEFNIAVYASQKDARFETNPVFVGVVSPVFAKLVKTDGSSAYSLLGIRTHAADSSSAKPLAVGKAFYAFDDAASATPEGVEGPSTTDASYTVFSLASATPSYENGAYVVTYNEAGESTDEAFIGTVTYVDQAGNIVLVESVPGIKDGVEVDIKSSFLADQKYYRTIKNLNSTKVTLSPLHANAVISVAEAQFADGFTPYKAVIDYVNSEGDLLWSDSVDVLDSNYAYSLPHSFSMSSASGVKLYEFTGVNDDAQVLFKAEKQKDTATTPSHTVVFDKDAAGLVEDGVLTLKAMYAAEAADGDVDFTLRAIDGVSGQTIGADQKVTVSPEKPTATFTPASKLEVDDVTYVPWAGNAGAMEFTWASLAEEDTNLLQYLYYVPEEYVAEAARTVTVQYMDVANGSVITAETLTIEPENNAYIEIAGPETFTHEGEEYVRLAGQSAPIKHSYFTPADTYTIYYRNVDDVLNAQVVIQRTQIIDTVRTVIIQNPAQGGNPATPNTAGVAVTPAVTDDGTVDAGLTQGDATAVINDENNPLATLDGTDTSTERAIEDNETPLAESLQQQGINPTIALVGGIALLAVLALCLAFLVIRRHKSNDNAQNHTVA